MFADSIAKRLDVIKHIRLGFAGDPVRGDGQFERLGMGMIRMAGNSEVRQRRRNNVAPEVFLTKIYI